MLLVMCGCTILAWVSCPSSKSMCGSQFDLVLEVASDVLTLTICQITFLHGAFGFGRDSPCMHLVGILASGNGLFYWMVVLQIPSLSTLSELVR